MTARTERELWQEYLDSLPIVAADDGPLTDDADTLRSASPAYHTSDPVLVAFARLGMLTIVMFAYVATLAYAPAILAELSNVVMAFRS